MSDAPHRLPWHRIVGHGPERVIALHGWFNDHRAFEPLFDLLDVERFTFVFPDARGYGRSRELLGDYTIAEMARDALALAEWLEWDVFHVVGHSMGGKAAQKVAIDGGDRIASLIAVTPVPAPSMPIDEATTGFFNSVCDQEQAALALIGESVGNRLPKEWMQRLLASSRETALPEAFRSYMRSFTQDDLSEGAASVTIPILALAGEHDNGVRKEIILDVFPRLFPNADVTIEVLINSGHYPMEEIPLYLVSRVERYLNSVAVAPHTSLT